MDLGKQFDQFSSVQPAVCWFPPPFGHKETIKAIEDWKKRTDKIKFGEVPDDRKYDQWSRNAGTIFLDSYVGKIVTWTIEKYSRASTFYNKSLYL